MMYCSRCDCDKPDNEFYWSKTKGRRLTICIACRRKRQRKLYRENTPRYLSYSRRYNLQRKRERFATLLERVSE